MISAVAADVGVDRLLERLLSTFLFEIGLIGVLRISYFFPLLSYLITNETQRVSMTGSMLHFFHSVWQRNGSSLHCIK